MQMSHQHGVHFGCAARRSILHTTYNIRLFGGVMVQYRKHDQLGLFAGLTPGQVTIMLLVIGWVSLCEQVNHLGVVACSSG